MSSRLISYRQFPALILGACLGVFLAITHTVFADREASIEHLPIEHLHTFAEVFARIKSDYVETVDDKELIEHAIAGMLSGLDPHSNFLNADSFREMRVGTSGEFGGLGIEVNMEDGYVKVVSPIDDTPAQRAGIQAGDLIVRLDKTPVKGMTLSDAVKIMRGKPGEPIKLTIAREGENKPLYITVIRDIIQVKSVKSKTLEAGYGYVRISQFQSHTGDDLHKAINTLLADNDNNLKGLVLDLRNNPGGVLNAAVAVSDTFLREGLIVYTEGRVSESQMKFKAKPKDLLSDAPIVVLVNNGSASASEIVAGALQDHKRAVIMGTKTFGKGSVQTIQPMSNDTALKLTTARYFTPNGRSIQGEGIVPDILLDRIKIASVEEIDTDLSVSEADLVGHIDQGSAKKDKTNDENDAEQTIKDIKNADKKEEEKEQPLAKRDYALYEALNLLKGLNIISQR
jgi:carboxyl-terminal processing protease